jgi:hypothetical protein
MTSAPDPIATSARASALLGLGAAGACALAWGERAAVAALVGAGLAFANLRAIQSFGLRAVTQLGGAAPGPAAASLATLLTAKMVALFALIWAVTRLGRLPTLPLVIGFFVFVPALLAGAVLYARQQGHEASTIAPLHHS